MVHPSFGRHGRERFLLANSSALKKMIARSLASLSASTYQAKSTDSAVTDDGKSSRTKIMPQKRRPKQPSPRTTTHHASAGDDFPIMIQARAHRASGAIS